MICSSALFNNLPSCLLMSGYAFFSSSTLLPMVLPPEVAKGDCSYSFAGCFFENTSTMPGNVVSSFGVMSQCRQIPICPDASLFGCKSRYSPHKPSYTKYGFSILFFRKHTRNDLFAPLCKHFQCEFDYKTTCKAIP